MQTNKAPLDPTLDLKFKKRLLVYAGIFVAWFALTYILTTAFFPATPIASATANPAVDQAASWSARFVTWVSSWRQWDSQWYERIWRDGYASYPRMLVFPPGYSFLVGGFSSLGIASFPTSAFLINLPALFVACLLVAEIGVRWFALPGAALFLFSLSAPATYFAFSVYSDAVFLALFWLMLTIGLIDPSRLPRRTQVAAWLLMLVLPFVRLTSYALASWVLLRRWYALATLLALAGWLGMNAALTGDPFHFLAAQELFVMPKGHFIDGLRYTLANAWPNSAPDFNMLFWVQFHGLPLLLLALLLATAAWFALKRQWVLALTIVAVAIFSRNQSFWRSAVRYDLPLWPFLAFPLLTWARFSAAPLLRWLAWIGFGILIVGGYVAQIYFGNLFRAGQWAF